MPTGILSPMHLLVVLLVALIVLGPKRLPGAGRALGHGLREFKDSISGAAPTAEAAQPRLSASDVSMTESSGPVRDTPLAAAPNTR